MALKIRLARGGSKKRPFYRIVVAEATAPRDGRFIEKLGTYNPLLEQNSAERVVLNSDRIKHWLSVGAMPSDRVNQFLATAGLVKAIERREMTKKNLPKRKAQERMKAETAAAEAAIKAAADAAEAAKAEKAAAAEAAKAEAAAAAEAAKAEKEAAKAAAADPVEATAPEAPVAEVSAPEAEDAAAIEKPAE